MDAMKKQLVLALLSPTWQQEMPQACQGAGGKEKGLLQYAQEQTFSLVAPKSRQHLGRGNLPTSPESSYVSSQKLLKQAVVPTQAQFSWVYLIWDFSPLSPHNEIKQMSNLLLAPCQPPAWSVFQLVAQSLNSHAASVTTLICFHWVSWCYCPVVSETINNSTHRYFV